MIITFANVLFFFSIDSPVFCRIRNVVGLLSLSKHVSVDILSSKTKMFYISPLILCNKQSRIWRRRTVGVWYVEESTDRLVKCLCTVLLHVSYQKQKQAWPEYNHNGGVPKYCHNHCILANNQRLVYRFHWVFLKFSRRLVW